MKTCILFITLLFISIISTAQNTFEKIITTGSEERAWSVIQTSEGGYAFLGSIILPPSYDSWLVKINSTGDTLWSKQFHGTGSYNSSDRALVQTADGGFTFIANRNGKANLFHTSSTGDSLWEKELFKGLGYALSPTSGNGYIVTGSASSPSFLRLSCAGSSGDLIWSREYQLIQPTLLASPTGFAVREIPDGGFIVAGQIMSGFSESSPFLLKTGLTGDSLWYRNYNWMFDASFYSVDTVSDGSFYACGTVNNAVNPNALIIKLNANGDTIWTKNQPAAGPQHFFSIRAAMDGGAIACGSYSSLTDSSKVYLEKFSAAGTLLWEKKIGKYYNAYGLSIERTNDNGFIICGDEVLTSTSSTHGLLIKTDGNGNMMGMFDPNLESDLQLYPNPAATITNLDFPDEYTQYPCKIRIYDIHGSVVKTQDLSHGQISIPINVSGLKSGVYSVVLESECLFFAPKRLIIQR